VVAVTIERGGFGVDAAAPATEEILAQYFHVKPGETTNGTTTTPATPTPTPTPAPAPTGPTGPARPE
jgi:hypothetical protein